MVMHADQLLAAAAGQETWMTQHLAELVSCESPTAELEAVSRCAGLLTELGAEAFGRPAERLTADGRPHLLWRALAPRPVLIIGHFDTVWPLGTTARWPFTVTDGIASGPGVFDMKAGLIQALAAVTLLDGDRGSVSMLATSDEETGSPSSRALIEQEARQARAVLVCEPSGDGGAIKIARKGVANYRLDVQGRAAHAGLEPERGTNAGIEMAHQILDLARLASPAAETTVTPTVLAAGTTGNTVPEAATLAVDVRAWTRAELDRVDTEIRTRTPRLAGATVTVSGGPNRLPLEPAMATRLAALAEAAAADLGLAFPPPVRAGGGSDGNFTAAIGVPTLDGLGAVGGNPHARGEHADLRRMPERAALLAALITRIMATPDGSAPGAA
jgi:glutamate carboxypeptidase